MCGNRTARLVAAAGLSAVALAALTGVSPAATREPLRNALAATRSPAPAHGSTARPRPAALRAMMHRSARRFAPAANEFQISSDDYGPAEIESVAAVLRSLDHGPELAQLSVFVATPGQIRDACGDTVIACYFPSEDQMVVSGIDRPVDGVPREFAIAHEYGHHVANARVDAALPAIQGATMRWATYERVCQLTRRGRLFPGSQGAHYWQNPEEAFAQSYARLNVPDAHVSWQYTPLLRPTATSLAKIHADVTDPWTGPVQERWSAALAGPPAGPAAAGGVRSGPTGVGAGRAVGAPPWIAAHLVRTPLDGPVSVSLEASAGASLSVTLRDPRAGRALARTTTDARGAAHIAYSNCGHAALRLEVRAISGAASFQAAIARP